MGLHVKVRLLQVTCLQINVKVEFLRENLNLGSNIFILFSFSQI